MFCIVHSKYVKCLHFDGVIFYLRFRNCHNTGIYSKCKLLKPDSDGECPLVAGLGGDAVLVMARAQHHGR